MATVDSDKVVCGGIHAMIVAVLVVTRKKNPSHFYLSDVQYFDHYIYKVVLLLFFHL